MYSSSYLADELDGKDYMDECKQLKTRPFCLMTSSELPMKKSGIELDPK